MDIQELQVRSEEETAAVAAEFAAQTKSAYVIVLRGDLGAGKTTFARAYLRALCEDQSLEVPSPTFTLVQTYDSPLGDIWHFDCYRLEDPEEVYELGWEEALGQAVILIEWAERIERLLPANYTEITLSPHQNEPNQRTITIKKVSS